MIWVTEFDGDKDGPIIFQFFDRELPEEIPFGRMTKIVNIQYPGGHQTNQTFGVFEKPIEWSGTFFGTYTVNGKTITAKNRVEEIYALMGRPLRFGFPVATVDGKIPGVSAEVATDSSEYKENGHKGVYIIEEFTPRARGLLHVEYTIRLVPHERQEKIKPTETTSVKITTNVSGAKKAAATLSASPRPAGQQAGKNNNKALDAMEPEPTGFNARFRAKRKKKK